MLFNSVEFLIFFPIVCLLYYIIPHRFRHILFLISSLLFVGYKEPVAVLFILLTTLITWTMGLIIEKSQSSSKEKQAGVWLAIGLLAIFGILTYLKYIPYLWSLFKRGELELILPLGISFYTFQTATYLIDIYRGECKSCRNVLKYAAFSTFFPTVLAGPIERAYNLLPQFDEVHTPDTDRMKNGLKYMLWGYFLKMVIVSRLTILNDYVKNDSSVTGLAVLIAVVCYSFRIYCDFAGYSYIAIGCAKICGFDIMRNFRQPYLSESVADFWRRWHISLSSWFKDYLYIPLGGNRKGKFRKYINVLIVFAISGIWHGANVTFLVWGLLNGIYQVIEGVLFAPYLRNKIIRPIKVIINFILITFTWIFFDANSLSDAVLYMGRLFRGPYLSAAVDGTVFNLGLGTLNFIFVIVALAILIISDVMCEKNNCDIAGLLVNTKWPVRLLVYWGLVVMILFSTNLSTQEFLYMNF